MEATCLTYGSEFAYSICVYNNHVDATLTQLVYEAVGVVDRLCLRSEYLEADAIRGCELGSVELRR